MRCKCCNKPFTPAISNRKGNLMFATTCSSCNGSYHQGYANSHEHTHGLDEEPLVMVAKTGSVRMENVL